MEKGKETGCWKERESTNKQGEDAKKKERVEEKDGVGKKGRESTDVIAQRSLYHQCILLQRFLPTQLQRITKQCI